MKQRSKSARGKQVASSKSRALGSRRASARPRTEQQFAAWIKADSARALAHAKDPEASRRQFGLPPARLQVKDTEQGVYVDQSSVHGQGVFADETISGGSTLFNVHDSEKMSYTSSMINASKDPNITVQLKGEEMVVTSLGTIEPGQELVADYHVPDSGVWHGPDQE